MTLGPMFATYAILSLLGIAGLLMSIFARKIRDSDDSLYKDLYGENSDEYIELRKKYFSGEFIPIVRVVGILFLLLSIFAIIKLR